MQKKNVEKVLTSNLANTLTGTIDEVVHNLAAIKQQYLSAGYDSLRLDYDINDEGNYYNFTLYGTRQETDVEAQLREKAEEFERLREEEREYMQYLILKRKFEGKNEH